MSTSIMGFCTHHLLEGSTHNAHGAFTTVYCQLRGLYLMGIVHVKYSPAQSGRL